MQNMKVYRILRWLGVLCAVHSGMVRAQGTVTPQVPGAVASQAQGRDAALETRLTEFAKAHHGKVALYATQLNTGRMVGLDPDAVVQTASVIKLTILFEAMEQVRAGKAHWDDKITLAPGDAVSGSGLLLFLDTPQTLTLKDILTLMVIMSGKPATEPMPADQPKFGLGKTTPAEMAEVMERIGLCQLDGPGRLPAGGLTSLPEKSLSVNDTAICGVAMKMLRNQFYRDTIPRYLEKLDSTETGSGIASKTGSLNAVRADVAIVAGKAGPMVLSVFTYDNEDKGWTADNEGELTIAKMAKAIVDAWAPDGIDRSEGHTSELQSLRDV